MANYLLNHTGAQIDEGIDAALNINNTIANRIGSTGPAGCRNLTRNPKFTINQRNVSGTVTLSAGAFGHDGWKAGASGCTYIFTTSQGRTTLTITAGSLIQTIDGNDLAAGANTHTLSWGGSCQGKIGAGSYGASGVTGSATGGTNINVEFGTGTLYEPQLERGSTSSAFSCLLDQLEEVRCYRYLQREPSSCIAICQNANYIVFMTKFRVEMRSLPTWLNCPQSLVSGSPAANQAAIYNYRASSYVTQTGAINPDLGFITPIGGRFYLTSNFANCAAADQLQALFYEPTLFSAEI